MNTAIRSHVSAAARRIAGAWAQSERVGQRLDSTRSGVSVGRPEDRPRWIGQQPICRDRERRR